MLVNSKKPPATECIVTRSYQAVAVLEDALEIKKQQY